MTDALEGPPVRQATLREQANAPRIGRARFIGNAAGIVLLILAIEIGLAFAGFRQVPPAKMPWLTLPNHWVALGGSVLAFLCLTDLAVRRRHDRGESGADCVALLFLLELIYGTSLFGLLASIPPAAIAAIAGLAGLYLVVTLAVLPGDKSANPYGPDPRLG
jgi:uncharacterized membrane protein YhaH (DUF805 family)